jgi:3-oxoacyl-(acyl-carrier-protein) synthase
MSERPVFITGTAAVTALGNLNETWQGLSLGAIALRPLDDTEQKTLEFSGLAGVVDALDKEAAGHVRMKQLMELLRDQLEPLLPLPDSTGLVLATTKGAVDELSEYSSTSGVRLSSIPLQPWNLGEYATKMFDITGPVSTVSAACASGTVAVIQAAMHILSGEAETMLVVGVDVLSRFVLSGFAGLQALSRTECRPFDRRRDGLVLGEGAAAVLLSGQAAQGTGDAPFPILAGWGISCDAVHITAPARDAGGLISALKSAACNAGCRVGGINAHGTATVYNDAMELEAFRQVWGPGKSPPFHSVKGAVGHCLGAAGVIETCMAVRSLEDGMIPPTPGLEEPEDPDMHASGKHGIPLENPSVLSCNSGFGGINAAILISQSANNGKRDTSC